MQFTTSYAIHPKINLKARMKEYGWTIEDFAKPAEELRQRGAQYDTWRNTAGR